MKMPVTPAIRVLREHKIPFEPFLYKYQAKGGTSHSATELGVDENNVIKTLIFENENRQPLVVLMMGNRQVSTKTLARQLNTKSLQPCQPQVAQKHSGYMVGGTSPFGTKTKMPIYLEQDILDLSFLYINGGKRGFLIKISPQDLVRVLQPTIVSVGIPS